MSSVLARLSENRQLTAHVVAEVCALIGLAVYFKRQNNGLEQRIQELTLVVGKQQEAIVELSNGLQTVAQKTSGNNFSMLVDKITMLEQQIEYLHTELLKTQRTVATQQKRPVPVTKPAEPEYDGDIDTEQVQRQKKVHFSPDKGSAEYQQQLDNEIASELEDLDKDLENGNDISDCESDE